MNTDLVVLCLNSGSSSLKFSLFRCTADGESLLASGAAEGVGREQGSFRLQIVGSPSERRTAVQLTEHDAAVEKTFHALAAENLPRPDAVGHRLVHGGPDHGAPERIDAPVMDALRSAVSFAPLHLPAELRAIELVLAHYPDLPQVACFDTGFHWRLPEIARRFPLPRAFYDRGVRRYGFHGLSYEYLVEKLGALLGARSILAHLGSGASMVALRDGKPIDTTMGLTPAGGFMMGTRPGDLDPGVVLHLIETGLSASALERVVNNESGLLGVSGTSSDMKVLLDCSSRDEGAALAVEMFCYQIRKSIGAFAAALGGIDCLVFTGGIGERAAPVRARICAGLEHLGIQVDPAQNERANESINAPESRCSVRVVPAGEELMIARHTRRLVGSPTAPQA